MRVDLWVGSPTGDTGEAQVSEHGGVHEEPAPCLSGCL